MYTTEREAEDNTELIFHEISNLIDIINKSLSPRNIAPGLAHFIIYLLNDLTRPHEKSFAHLFF
ncbi:hypothetical protein E5H75_26350 [Escherichia coli]|nr:hypothetical protein [Salmonella enterica]EBP9865185.1 hypothetical protein [Salmonella enterica subsp. enterica]ECH7483316.1 hypothetical protein [Salmonella enterica subsp. enterica serovar Reading]ECK2811093.1 hypothetical protein [Salmonella enterica subsp. enterica serovar Muenchen]ECT2093130.1 hypothetical protein [Salmonella enterica subsp. enterica serovar Montevideo]ECX5016108.1 hypothetical protein [Salmonella enterica subsp. enterica serovar Agona]EDD0588240.1 hypothetical prote